MARITVEDALKNIPNEFELVMLGAKRAQQLIKGAEPLVKSDNREVVLALREIEAGKVRKARKELRPLARSAPSNAHKGGA
jgi:DNA-directed RNA polymerase subunit omega